MNRLLLGLTLAALVATTGPTQEPGLGQQVRTQCTAPNRDIDYDAFLANAVEVGKLRQQRRVGEQDFLETSREPDTIILDARSDAKYRTATATRTCTSSAP